MINLAGIVIGLLVLIGGGALLVQGSMQIAGRLEISTMIVGLTIVSFGTSAPELVTSVIAAVRGESDLALGNIIGSNIFNALFALPASGLVRGITVPSGGLQDLLVSWLFVAALIPIFFFGDARLSRMTGVIFLVAYFVYAVNRSILGNQFAVNCCTCPVPRISRDRQLTRIANANTRVQYESSSMTRRILTWNSLGFGQANSSRRCRRRCKTSRPIFLSCCSPLCSSWSAGSWPEYCASCR